MRLLNTSSLEFQEFFDESRPRYAILSHRWSGDETSYKEFSKGKRQESAGYQKVVAFCRFAKGEGHDWVWVDTCCIDKRSSAELSEAINSMFRWYQDAEVCYAYLADVTPSWRLEGRSSLERQDGAFANSEWFTRGWTLQELLAPSNLVFLDVTWTVIGDRCDLRNTIAESTGIEQSYLLNTDSIFGASTAARMSWVSKRQTTRKEDMAYCMLGMFDVNMPLLYGEGEKAFIRLQLEIIRKSTDDSIFAWSVLTDAELEPGTGMLAATPRAFMECGQVERGDEAPENMANKLTYSMTHQGLKLRVANERILEPEPGSEIQKIRLSCAVGESENRRYARVTLMRNARNTKEGRRFTTSTLFPEMTLEDWKQPRAGGQQTFYLKQRGL